MNNCFFFSSTVYAYILKWTHEPGVTTSIYQKHFTFSVLFENSCCQTKCFTLKQNYKMTSDLSAAGNKEVQL